MPRRKRSKFNCRSRRKSRCSHMSRISEHRYNSVIERRAYFKHYRSNQRKQRKSKNIIHKQHEQIEQLSQTVNKLSTDNIDLSYENEMNYIEQPIKSDDTDQDEDNEYKPKPKWSDKDLVIIFDLIQFIPYRFLNKAINAIRLLSDDFQLPSIGYLNRLAQTKKHILNQAIIAFETEFGEYHNNSLCIGMDGSSMHGAKFQSGNLMIPNDDKDGFKQLMIFQNKLVSGDSNAITTMINDQLSTINDFKKYLRQIHNKFIQCGRS